MDKATATYVARASATSYLVIDTNINYSGSVNVAIAAIIATDTS